MMDASPMAARMKIMMNPFLLQKNLVALPSMKSRHVSSIKTIESAWFSCIIVTYLGFSWSCSHDRLGSRRSAGVWPVELYVRGRSNYGYAAHRIADVSEATSVLRRRVRPEGRTVSPLEAGWASNVGVWHRFATRRQRRWACVAWVSVCACGAVVVGGLVCGGWIGVEMCGNRTLVSAKTGSIWCGCVCTVGA